MATTLLDRHSAQMNVRMDRQLKEAGDAVLASLGMTPSQAVRALWEYLVINERMPSKGDAAAPVSDGVEPRRMESRAAQGSHIVRDSCLKYGIPIPEFSGDYDDLYEEAMADRYPEWVEL